MPRTAAYRRVLLDLRHAAIDRGGIRAAAELAHLLGLDLTGVFVEDAALLGLPEYPFARELRLPGHEWHPLEPTRIAEEVRAAAEAARRLLDEYSAALGIQSLFEVVRGDATLSIDALSEASDIVVLIEPAAASERLARAFLRRPPPGRSGAAMLVVPPRVLRHHGPVAAVVQTATDPGLITAAAIAAAASERLLVLLIPRGDAGLKAAAIAAARAAGMPAERIQTRLLRAATPEAVLHALGKTQERLLVLTRGGDLLPDTVPSWLAAARQVPVLLVGPEAEQAER
jgi:hypothetical protein